MLCQIEIQVNDLEESVTFYERVFGWSSAPTVIEGYHVFRCGDDQPYGLCLVKSSKTHIEPNGLKVNIYFRVDNIERAAEEAVMEGGNRLGKPRTMPGYGRVCFISDPSGHRWGLFEDHG